MIERDASCMGRDKIRYLRFIYGRWRWLPTAPMRAAGFAAMSWRDETQAKSKALELNADWDRRRTGLPEAQVAARRYPAGSIGEAYLRVMSLRAKERELKGIVWTSEQHSRDDWPRAWKWIDPLLGDCDPRTVTPEHLMGDPADPERVGLRQLTATKVSESEAHRVIKVWRALWKKMAVLGYCDLDRDPSLTFTNPAPAPRKKSWHEGEAARLVKCAWRKGYHGLAALLATAWDSQLSPVDARGLTAADLRSDTIGMWFELDRAKTGREAVATLSRRTRRLVEAYFGKLEAQPIGRAPVFRNRSGRPYSKDTLGDDFRDVRAMVFGPSEDRQLADFRRSGTLEALAGQVDPGTLSQKMANSIATSNRLHRTYAPVQLAAVRQADAARQRGRTKTRDARLPTSTTLAALGPVKTDKKS